MKTTIIATCLMTLAGCADAAEREPLPTCDPGLDFLGRDEDEGYVYPSCYDPEYGPGVPFSDIEDLGSYITVCDAEESEAYETYLATCQWVEADAFHARRQRPLCRDGATPYCAHYIRDLGCDDPDGSNTCPVFD